MRTFIVLPTYNEKENIGPLLDRILEVLKPVKAHKVDVLVVDDSSPDGTGKVVEDYARKHKNIHLLTGQKEGLGRAYLRGFKHVMDEYEADAVFMMDADFSHDPAMIPHFLKKLEDGYDFVIGSRYIKGGSIPDWGWNRRVVSRFGNLFARFIGGLYKVNDCTSGYRAIRISVLKKMDFSSLNTRGYAFLTTVLYEAIAGGAKVAEIPITFRDRTRGETKLKKKDMVEFFMNVLRLRYKGSKHFIKFLIVGASGVLVNLGLLYLLVDIAGLEKTILAPSIAIGASILYNFILNNAWTFGDRKTESGFMGKLVKYSIVALTGVAINLAIYNFLLNSGMLGFAGRFDYLVSQFISIIIVTLWNYTLSKKWAWK